MPVDFEPTPAHTVDFEPTPEAAPAKTTVDFQPTSSAVDFTPTLPDHWYNKQLATVSADTIEKLLPDVVTELVGKEGNRGMAEELADTVNGLLTPKGLGTVALAAAAPVTMAGVFAGLGAKQLGESAGTLWGSKDTADTKELTKLGTRAALVLGQTVAGSTVVFKAASKALANAQAKLNPTTLDEPSVAPATEPVPRTATENTDTRLGIMPPGTAEAAAVVRESATKLNQLRQGFQNFMASDPVREELVRKFDAADTQAKVEGEQVGNSVRLDVPDAMDRKAITFVIEANGDKARLADFEAQALAGENIGALEAIRHARDNWDTLEPAAERVTTLQDAQLEYEQSNGIDPGNHEAYVKHAYDMDVMLGKGRPVVLQNTLGSSGGGVGTAFTKQRAFATYADAIEAGYKPKTFDIADLVQSRVTAGERLVNRNQWANSLSEVRDPVEGRPIVTSVVTQSPKGTQVAPMGYVRGEVIPGVPIAVHEGYASLIKSLTGTSWLKDLEVRGLPVGKALMGAEGMVKHGMLMFDTFHAGRMIYKELALTQRVGHDLGRSLLEYADEDLAKAVAQKEITPEAAAFAKARRPDAELLTANGLNVGRISDALNREVLTSLEKIPGIDKAVTGVIKPFNRWVFDKLTRGAMLHSGLMELDRLRKAMPDASDAQLAGYVAKNMNTYYGNLGKQGWIKDAGMQDLMRLTFLAPQWVEGMVRTEIGAVSQTAKTVAGAAQGKGVVVGPLAKGVGTGVAAMVVATQLINLASRGHPTWQNEEHGHQMDAWIPDLTGKGNGFWLSPLGIHAELTHDALRYYNESPHALKVAAKIFSNKLSPLAHAEETLRTGKDWMENNLDGTWDRIKASGAALVPAPIPLQTLFKDGPPGSLQRQITASLGIKTEPVQTADSQMFSELRRYNDAHGIKNEASAPSEYRDLNNALKNGDNKAAREAYSILVAMKGEKTVLEHFSKLASRLYTGSRVREAAFKSSLNDTQKVLLDKALEERIQLSTKFFDMVDKTTAKP